jgi:hypothetical protein
MSRYLANVTWDEVPHLSESEKTELWKAIPAYQRKARSKGIPVLGKGVIYPFDEERVKVTPFPIPRHWPRCFGLDSDAGAGVTAIVWGAWDRESSTVYLTHDYKSDSRSKADHVEALRAKGTKKNPLWIPGVGDAKGLVVTEKDSIQVIKIYQEAGVDISFPDKSVEAGIQDVYDLINTGKFKVFSSCSDYFTEFRMYHRNEKGVIVKANDHLMDAKRYMVRSGLGVSRVAPTEDVEDLVQRLVYDEGSQGTGWMST